MKKRESISVPVAAFLKMLWLCSGCIALLPFVISAQESATLSLEPSANTNVTGYNIYYGVSSRKYTTKISVGNNMNVTISGLVQGTKYFFAATATDPWGDESDFSNEISYKVPTAGNSPPPSSSTVTNYSGLFSEPDAVRPQSAGAFKLSVSPGGAYSGSLQMGKAQHRFSGLLSPSFQATTQIPRKNENALALTFSLGYSNQIIGAVSDGTWTANLYAERMAPGSATNYPGKYTLLFQGDTSILPSLGNGFGVLTVSSTETIKFVGALADGTKLKQSASFTQNGNWPIYISLYSGNGLAMGWLTVANGGQAGLTGVLSWIKPPNSKSLLYKNGLAVQCTTFRTLYNPGLTLFANLADANTVFGGAAAQNPSEGEIVLLSLSKK